MMFARGGMHGFGNFFGGSCLGGSYGYYGGPMMMFLGLLLIGVLVYVVYKANNKQKFSNFGQSDASSEALDVLKMKFVNGEITEEEYLRKRNLLLK